MKQPLHATGSHITIEKDNAYVAVVFLGQFSDGSTGKANARLIAASPLLVEDLAVCFQTLGDKMQPDFRARVERHLKEALNA